ncbi:MAG TPA: type II secretion system protein GspM [Rhodopila sp.]|nr:type II secretion system protein GspM [Rhodopila sp.]
MTADPWLTGRAGQALAIAIVLLVVAVGWFGAVGPVLSWYHDRNLLLERRQALLHRMQDVAATLPALRAASGKPDPDDTAATSMVPGATDAVAAADLQERVQQMAGAAGAGLTAIETLPATVTGEWHRVSLRVSLTAPWPVLMDLLRAIEQSPTRILIDDVHFHSATVVTHPTVLPVQASMVVYGFRPAAATARSGDGP